MPTKNVQRKKKAMKPAVYLSGAAALIVVILAVVFLAKPGGVNAKPGNTAANTGDLVIQTKNISDKASFYPLEVDGVKMEVLALKAPDGTIRTAFNTCQVCYDSGRGYYVQQGNVLVCQNCGNRFRASDVEKVKGGCNPLPIMEKDKMVNDTTITISQEVLIAAKNYFLKWKY